jgi:hypothetical protein
MTTFNLKKNKQRFVTEIKTLDEMHTNNINNFNLMKSSISDKKRELENLKSKLAKIELGNFAEYTMENVKERSDIKERIEELTREIYMIENNTNEMEYYSKTLGIINDYYSSKMGVYDFSEDTVEEEKPIVTEFQKTNMDMLDKLNSQSKCNKRAKRTPKKRKVQDNYCRPSILSYLSKDEDSDVPSSDQSDSEVTKIADQSIMLSRYNMLVNNEYISNKNLNYINLTKCDVCGKERILDKSEAIYVCKTCGSFEMINVEADKPSYKDVSTDKPGYPYKRINHFNEWLSQFQAKESFEIPSEIYVQITNELYKNRITDFKKLKLKQVKLILKTLLLANYYEHVVHIISRLSGLPPPVIDRDTEDKLRKMFRMIQIPFENHRPKDRINFLSYSFVLHKFCQLLELDEFIKCFPLLKSRDKLRQQDNIWKGICADLKWEYYPSI